MRHFMHARNSGMDENKLAVFYNPLSVLLYAPAHISTMFSEHGSSLPPVLHR
jgi:hypothetical protein